MTSCTFESPDQDLAETQSFPKDGHFLNRGSMTSQSADSSHLKYINVSTGTQHLRPGDSSDGTTALIIGTVSTKPSVGRNKLKPAVNLPTGALKRNDADWSSIRNDDSVAHLEKSRSQISDRQGFDSDNTCLIRAARNKTVNSEVEERRGSYQVKHEELERMTRERDTPSNNCRGRNMCRDKCESLIVTDFIKPENKKLSLPPSQDIDIETELAIWEPSDQLPNDRLQLNSRSMKETKNEELLLRRPLRQSSVSPFRICMTMVKPSRWIRGSKSVEILNSRNASTSGRKVKRRALSKEWQIVTVTTREETTTIIKKKTEIVDDKSTCTSNFNEKCNADGTKNDALGVGIIEFRQTIACGLNTTQNQEIADNLSSVFNDSELASTDTDGEFRTVDTPECYHIEVYSDITGTVGVDQINCEKALTVSREYDNLCKCYSAAEEDDINFDFSQDDLLSSSDDHFEDHMIIREEDEDERSISLTSTNEKVNVTDSTPSRLESVHYFVNNKLFESCQHDQQQQQQHSRRHCHTEDSAVVDSFADLNIGDDNRNKTDKAVEGPSSPRNQMNDEDVFPEKAFLESLVSSLGTIVFLLLAAFIFHVFSRIVEHEL